ncbi:hypothetical protein ACFL2M_02505, partial [Patescibacteria group bacterium]
LPQPLSTEGQLVRRAFPNCFKRVEQPRTELSEILETATDNDDDPDTPADLAELKAAMNGALDDLELPMLSLNADSLVELEDGLTKLSELNWDLCLVGMTIQWMGRQFVIVESSFELELRVVPAEAVKVDIDPSTYFAEKGSLGYLEE